MLRTMKGLLTFSLLISALCAAQETPKAAPAEDTVVSLQSALKTEKQKFAIKEAQLKLERIQRQSDAIQLALEEARKELVAAIEAFRPTGCQRCQLTDSLVWQQPKDKTEVEEKTQ